MGKIDLPHGYEFEIGYSSSNLPPGEKGMRVGVGKWIELRRQHIYCTGDRTGWHKIVRFEDENQIKILASACNTEWEYLKIFEVITDKKAGMDRDFNLFVD
jgi:hypothetical protein